MIVTLFFVISHRGIRWERPCPMDIVLMGAPIDRAEGGSTHAQWALFWWAPPSIGPRPYPMLLCPFRALMPPTGAYNLAQGLAPG